MTKKDTLIARLDLMTINKCPWVLQEGHSRTNNHFEFFPYSFPYLQLYYCHSLDGRKPTSFTFQLTSQF